MVSNSLPIENGKGPQELQSDFPNADFRAVASSISTISDNIKYLLNCLPSQVRLQENSDFYNLSAISESKELINALWASVGAQVDFFLRNRDFAHARPLDVTDSSLIHSKIYQGVDYHNHGPVIVNADHLARIFTNFEKPSQEEIAARAVINKDIYGTMPAVESAYTAAIVKALQPRTLLMIGEHRGALTDYLAKSAPQECLIFTLDLPPSMYELAGVQQLDGINQSYMTYTESQLGHIWRNSGQEYAKHIIGFAGDSTHEHSLPLFQALEGNIDLVVVDGNHAYDAVASDLKTAAKLLTKGGVIILDDFWKPARLFEVTRAALNFQKDPDGLKHFYHLSWGAGEPETQISSNLAFFVKC